MNKLYSGTPCSCPQCQRTLRWIRLMPYLALGELVFLLALTIYILTK